MKTTSLQHTRKSVQMAGLVLCLSALPLVAIMSTGCMGDRYTQSTGEQIDDHSISFRVKSKLAHDGEYKYDDVKVTTFKGLVQLNGFVNTPDQKRHAAEVAMTVDGVREVQNNITLKEKATN